MNGWMDWEAQAFWLAEGEGWLRWFDMQWCMWDDED
jgi:hypothetical protein